MLEYIDCGFGTSLSKKGRKGMNARALFWVIVGVTLPSLPFAQTARDATSEAQLSAQIGLQTKGAYITKFFVGANGILHITYSNGVDVEIPREGGRFTDGGHALTQETFSDIQLADDQQHIGWLAGYMICAQSYPCPAELVIYQSGHDLQHISPSHGIVWRWKFLGRGKQVVGQFGFTHGDDEGVFALYDTEIARELAQFSSTKKPPPKWVKQLRSAGK